MHPLSDWHSRSFFMHFNLIVSLLSWHYLTSSWQDFTSIPVSIGLVRIENKTKQPKYYVFVIVRENDVVVVKRTKFLYFLILLRPDSYFGDAIQDSKPLFFSRLPQMTKYFVMREHENIPHWISLCCDSAFAHKKEFSIFNSLKGFRRSLVQRSHFFCFFDHFILSICYTRFLKCRIL